MPGKRSEQVQAEIDAASSILLQPHTKTALQELHEDLSRRDKDYLWSYDRMIMELIKSYRIRKRLGPIWGSQD